MNTQRSFTKLERQMFPAYRARINAAESIEDVRNFFERTGLAFLKAALPEFNFALEDILFEPETEEGYLLGKRLRNDRNFQTACQESDLKYILKRFSSLASRRHAHLQTYTDRTEAKTYTIHGPR